MLCRNCKQEIDNQMNCPYCGAIQEVAPQQPAAAPAAPAPKKSSKKPIAIAVLCVAIVAVIVAVVLIATGKLNIGKKKAGDVEYASDNVFASTMDGMTQDTDAYYVMDSAAAVDNTLFNSESLTFTYNDGDSDVVLGKIAFGEDLVSSEFYLNVEDDVYVALYDGQLAVSSDDFGLKVNVKDVLTDELFEKAEGLLTAVLSQTGSENASEAEATYEDVRENLPRLIEDNKLNRDAINEILKVVFPIFFGRVSDGFSIDSVIEDENLVSLVKELSTFLSRIDDILSIESNEDGSEKTYTLNLTENAGYRVAQEFVNFLKENQTVRALIGQIYVDKFVDEVDEDVQSAAERTAGDTDVVAYVKLALNDGFIKSLNVNDEFTLSIDSVNDTGVTGSDYANVEALASNSGNLIEINTVNDVFSMLMNFGM